MPKRLGDTSSVQNPRIIRSHAVRFGLRRCERFMISNWCLTASDSAATARTPPGPASRARQVGDQTKQQPHREPSFSPLRSFRKSAQQLGLLSELPIRHTQVHRGLRHRRLEGRQDAARRVGQIASGGSVVERQEGSGRRHHAEAGDGRSSLRAHAPSP